MDLLPIFATAGAIITSVGGSGVIICAVASFLSNRIANRMEAKFQQRLDKQMEEYKTRLENKRYITQAQFNVEFEVYRKLSKAFFELWAQLSTELRQNSSEENTNELKKLQYLETTYHSMVKIATHAQSILYENSPFIPLDIHKKYEELYEMFNALFWRYHERSLAYAQGKIKYTQRFNESEQNYLQEIQNRLFEVNTAVRSHLETISIK